MDFEIATPNVIDFPPLKHGPISSPDPQGSAGAVGPIEREMRAKLAKLKGSKYPDTFDWSIYNQISSRFSEPPRGGVVFNTTFKVVNHHATCTRCHYSFELDSYGRGCFHDCAYCYAKEQLTSHGYWNRPQPFPVNLAEIRKAFFTVFETDKESKWRNIMEQRIPLRLGSMSDSFLWLDAKYGVTLELLNILSFYNYPYVIFTRSDLVAHDDYIAALRPDLCSVQFSISGNNAPLIRKLEPGAPNYRRRLQALKKLGQEGFRTGVRINPLFPRFPDGYYTDPNYVSGRFGSAIPTMPTFDDEFIPQLAETGTKTVIAGFVRLSTIAVNTISKTLSINLKSFFRPELLSTKGGGGDNRFSESEIGYYYRFLQKQCSNNGVRFTTCYIGNGLKDYFQYQTLWSNKQDCCDIVAYVPAFKKTSQGISWQERLKHSSNHVASKAAMIADQHAETQQSTLPVTPQPAPDQNPLRV